MSYASTAPLALRALTELVEGLMPDDTVTVQGPSITGTIKAAAVVIGDGDGANPGVEHLVGLGDVAMVQQNERYVINSSIRVRHGGTDIPAATDTAYARYALIGAALTGNKTLAVARVRTARIVAANLQFAQGPKGAEVHLRFSVQCDAMTLP